MNSIYEILEAIGIGSIVAVFLLNTARVPKAIELLKECLFILNNKSVDKRNIVIKLLYEWINSLLIEAYCRVNDYSSAIKFCRKRLDLQRKCGDRAKESELLIKLATLYQRQSKYVEAKELYGEAIAVTKVTGNRRREAECYSRLAIMYKIQSQYVKAEEYLMKAIAINKEIGYKRGEATDYGNLGTVFRSVGNYEKAKEYQEKALEISKDIGDKYGIAAAYGNLGTVLECLSEYDKAKDCLEKALLIGREIGDRNGEAANYTRLGTVFHSLSEYVKAKESHGKALVIAREIGDKYIEAAAYSGLGTACRILGEYKKAVEYHEKALAIAKETGHKEGEASSCGNLGEIFQRLGEYRKAKEHHEKALAIRTEIGDKEGQAADFGNLGGVFHFLGENATAKELFDRELAIRKEIGDRQGEASCYGRQGVIYQRLGEYKKAKDYYVKENMITKEIGDRQGEASSYGHLGEVSSPGEYVKAIEYHQKALTIRKEIGDRSGEASSYNNLGATFHSRFENDKAKECHEKELAIRQEIGDRNREASSYNSLGAVSSSLGEFTNANEYYNRALEISEEIGDKHGQAESNGNLGVLFHSLGEYHKAIECYEKALEIATEFGDRALEATLYGNLGATYHYLGDYGEADKYLNDALEIRKEIGDLSGEARDYAGLGTLCRVIGKYTEAKEYHEKALAIRKEIGDREGEAIDYGNLGTACQYLGEYGKVEEYFKKAVAITSEIGDVVNQVPFLCKLAWLYISEGNFPEAGSYLLQSIQKCEELRCFLGNNDQFKISFSDKHDFPYWTLSDMLCSTGNYNEALYVSELGRARALVDLMAAQYSVESQISVDPQSWIGIEKIMKKETNCTCLYIALVAPKLFAWVVNERGVVHFRQTKVDENTFDVSNMDNIRSLNILPGECCEDRSFNEMKPSPKPSQEARQTDLPRSQPCQDQEDSQEGEPILSLYYKLIIAPVVSLFQEPEIIIVPDRSLYKVPFAALPHESGKCLSERFRIRIVPSLTTLKLIQDSPADYHSQTGALIVGDPNVGWVRYKKKRKEIKRLPCARKEAEMIGRLLGVQPLFGEQATKQVVLERLNSASLIHFAAHGDSDTGEIALAANRPTSKRLPKEEEYLLKMSDISKVQLRAKLVVLSCCHSGRGQIRAEGVVGIARAFLGSGARSVLAALWALDDSATEQFMNHFYDQLVRGESAGESLHQAMDWMRSNGYSDVRQWAPFMLIGDNVTFEFGKQK